MYSNPLNTLTLDIKEYYKIRDKYNNTDEKKIISPLIDSKVSLPDEFPSIPNINYLGEPLSISKNEEELTINFNGGRVEYFFHPRFLQYIPHRATIFSVLNSEGKRSLNTEKFDTKIYFLTLESEKDEEYITPKMQFYQIPDGPILGIDIFEGEKEILKEWWSTGKRG